MHYTHICIHTCTYSCILTDIRADIMFEQACVVSESVSSVAAADDGAAAGDVGHPQLRLVRIERVDSDTHGKSRVALVRISGATTILIP